MEDKEQSRIKKEKLKPHPRSRANFLTHFFFCWEIPIIFKGWRKDLTEDDLYSPLEEYESRSLGDKLETLWLEEEHFQKDPSLWRCLIKLFGFEFMIPGLCYAPIHIVSACLQTFLLRKVLDFYTENRENLQDAYSYAGGLALVACCRILLFHFFMFASTVVGMKVKVACSSLIYRKALSMKKTTIDKITLGQMVNLLSNDVSRFDQVTPYLHFLWIGMLELVVSIYYMDVTLGHAALGGVAIILLSLIAQVVALVQISKSRRRVAEQTDYRIRLMNDIICGIEAIKMYTWEKPFMKLVQLSRSSELAQVTVSSHFRLFINTFKIYIGKFCVFLSILVAVFTKLPLTSQYAFSLTSQYESLKLSVMVFLPIAAIMFTEGLVSVQRIQTFLLTDHHQPSLKPMKSLNKNVGIKVLKFYKETNALGVALDNISVKWDSSYSHVLKNVTLRVSPRELVGVIGTAGSGKSTLLHVILKEVEVDKGRVEVSGRVSYASQESWIFPTSLKQNILFGQEYHHDRYLQVVRVCALERDLTLFPHGDQTLVGERGVMLSGGQKARVNLARAIYKEADLYLLDDPLSAVDSHVARHIYNECIVGFLKDKMVVLITHQVHFLQKASRIYQLESGVVVKTGNYEEVVGSCDSTFDSFSMEPTAVLTKHELREEVKEHRSSGTTTWKIYKSYCLSAGTWGYTLLVLFLFVLAQIVTSLLDGFLTFWTNLEQKTFELSGSFWEFFTTENSTYVYIGLTLGMVLVNHLAVVVFTFFSLEASKSLHQKMLSKIISSPMMFFNHHASGRILNRFSKDLGCIDEVLPMHLMNGLTTGSTALAILVIIVALNYWMVFPSVFLVGIISFFICVFQPVNRNIKRTEGTTRSMVFTHISTTIQGLTTIRAQGAQTQLIQEFDDHQNLHSSAYYLFTATFAAFGFWADLVSAFYTVLVIFSFFLISSQTHPGNVGLAITQSMNLLGMVQYGVKTYGELDSQMTSVERVIEYGELEPKQDEGGITPEGTWPEVATLSFQDVTLKYSPDDPAVLKKTSFEIQAGEKVGIIGRTGAGKTSLISILFRLFNFDGRVVIDGIDTKTIPLESLRSRISIIPQEPILFLGTLRKNIDPFDEYNDSQIWNALEELELKPTISNLPSGLQSLVTERGSNFSVGERQLLCLVRAILRNNRIIVLDEATANVDLKTDELIQKLIRKKFKGCTVLTIAHRLNTIIDSDKILAMDGGRVVEFDHPYRLLQDPDGYFYGFVKKNGDKMMEEFLRIAKQSFEEDVNNPDDF